MKIAVLSDVHGFSIALDRVLADIAREPDIDQIIVAGDLVEGGPDPVGSLDTLRASGAILLQGNTDRDLAASARDSRHFAFAAGLLGDNNLRFLGDLPFSHRISPPGGTAPDADLLVVHANPYDLDRPIAPHTSVAQVTDLIGETRAAVIAFGHIHIAYIRQLDQMTLIDVSAVGNPKDGDLRSKWGLISWSPDARRWSVELRFVPYPLEETIEQINACNYPKASNAIAKLRLASYVNWP
ncbi:MAG: metallophosphoesterase [Thermomicrobiales bacterium]